MHRLRNRLILIAAALLLIVLGGTVGFVVVEQYSWFDAFYMTLITVSTVGYAEVHPLSHAGRVFNSFLIFFGVTIMLLRSEDHTSKLQSPDHLVSRLLL